MVTINHVKLRSVILHIVMSRWIRDILAIGKQTETIIASNRRVVFKMENKYMIMTNDPVTGSPDGILSFIVKYL